MYYTKIKVYDRHRGEVRVQGIKRRIYISNDEEQLAHAFFKIDDEENQNAIYLEAFGYTEQSGVAYFYVAKVKHSENDSFTTTTSSQSFKYHQPPD